MTKLKPRSKEDRRKKRRGAFMKIIEQHYPECYVSYNPPFGWATHPVLMRGDGNGPVGEALLERAAKGAKFALFVPLKSK